MSEKAIKINPEKTQEQITAQMQRIVERSGKLGVITANLMKESGNTVWPAQGDPDYLLPYEVSDGWQLESRAENVDGYPMYGPDNKQGLMSIATKSGRIDMGHYDFDPDTGRDKLYRTAVGLDTNGVGNYVSNDVEKLYRRHEGHFRSVKTADKLIVVDGDEYQGAPVKDRYVGGEADIAKALVIQRRANSMMRNEREKAKQRIAENGMRKAS